MNIKDKLHRLEKFQIGGMNWTIKEVILQEEDREKRENEVLSVIKIVDDDTKLAS